MEELVEDVIETTREVIALGNDELRGISALPSHALVLYLWSLKLLYRTFLQSQQVQSRCCGLLPKHVVADWQGRLSWYLVDDFEKARLALRLSIQLSSSSSDQAWVTEGGMLNDKVISSPAAPRPQRLAYDAARKYAREAASAEILSNGVVGSDDVAENRVLYRRASLLLCAVMLDWDAPPKDLAAVSLYGQLTARRLEELKSHSRPASAGGGAEGDGDTISVRVERCSRQNRLWAVERPGGALHSQRQPPPFASPRHHPHPSISNPH
jgi:hypothetical protein